MVEAQSQIAPAPPLPSSSLPASSPDRDIDKHHAASAIESTPKSLSKTFVRLPTELKAFMSHKDRSLLRLNKLLSTTAGLDSLLATLNYSLYLLAYLQTRLPSRTRLLSLLSRFLARRNASIPPKNSSMSPLPSTNPSTLLLLGSLISNTRTTLRLTSLVPLYAWLRSLLILQQKRSTSSTSPAVPDPYIQAITLVQCISYILYQILENIAHLRDHSITVSLPFRRKPSTPISNAKVWLLSNRLWLLGVSCDVLRLAREASLVRARRSNANVVSAKDDAAVAVQDKSIEAEPASAVDDRRWWNEALVTACWLPLCVHWSVEGGLKGVNDGVIGLLGMVAGWETLRAGWEATAAGV